MLPHGFVHTYGLHWGLGMGWRKVYLRGMKAEVEILNRKVSHGFEKSNDFSGELCKCFDGSFICKARKILFCSTSFFIQTREKFTKHIESKKKDFVTQTLF